MEMFSLIWYSTIPAKPRIGVIHALVSTALFSRCKFFFATLAINASHSVIKLSESGLFLSSFLNTMLFYLRMKMFIGGGESSAHLTEGYFKPVFADPFQ